MLGPPQGVREEDARNETSEGKARESLESWGQGISQKLVKAGVIPSVRRGREVMTRTPRCPYI